MSVVVSGIIDSGHNETLSERGGIHGRSVETRKESVMNLADCVEIDAGGWYHRGE